jgi:hypothetical protein
MKTTIACLLILLACSALFADDKYVNETLGFELSSPVPASFSGVYQSCMFYLPAADGFAANVNIQIQDFTGTMDQYKSISEAQFKQAGIAILSSRIDQGVFTIEYQGKMGTPNEFHWFAKAYKKADHIYLVTATALQKHWNDQGSTLVKSVNTFRLK